MKCSFTYAATIGIFAILTAAGPAVDAQEEAVVGAVASEAAEAATSWTLRALLITGGCCHDYEAQKIILSVGIGERAIERGGEIQWTILHEGGESSDHRVSIYGQPDWAKGYDVVLHNECFGAVTDNAFVEQIARAHHEGTPAVVLHCTMHSYRRATTDAWREMLGVRSMRHERRKGPMTVRNQAADNPIMAEFGETWETPNGELYIIEKVYPNVTPLAVAHSPEEDADQLVIWTNQYGKGRIFGTTIGHHNETMEDPKYLDTVARGLLWAAGRLN
jgi:type 1 glutamine amidotransferase